MSVPDTSQTLTPEGKRHADARIEAAMDAFYPGEDWRVALGIALPDSLRDMRAAIAAADALAAGNADGADAWRPIETAPSEPDCYHDLPGASDSGLGFATNADTGEIEYLLWWERTGHSSSIVTHWHPKLAGPTGRAALAGRGGADG